MIGYFPNAGQSSISVDGLRITRSGIIKEDNVAHEGLDKAVEIGFIRRLKSISAPKYVEDIDKGIKRTYDEWVEIIGEPKETLCSPASDTVTPEFGLITKEGINESVPEFYSKIPKFKTLKEYKEYLNQFTIESLRVITKELLKLDIENLDDAGFLSEIAHHIYIEKSDSVEKALGLTNPEDKTKSFVAVPEGEHPEYEPKVNIPAYDTEEEFGTHLKQYSIHTLRRIVNHCDLDIALTKLSKSKLRVALASSFHDTLKGISNETI